MRLVCIQAQTVVLVLRVAAKCSISVLVLRQILLFRLGANQESLTCWQEYFPSTGIIYTYINIFSKSPNYQTYRIWGGGSGYGASNISRKRKPEIIPEKLSQCNFSTKFLQEFSRILIQTSTLRFRPLSPISVERRYILTILHWAMGVWWWDSTKHRNEPLLVS